MSQFAILNAKESSGFNVRHLQRPSLSIAPRLIRETAHRLSSDPNLRADFVRNPSTVVGDLIESNRASIQREDPALMTTEACTAYVVCTYVVAVGVAAGVVVAAGIYVAVVTQCALWTEGCELRHSMEHPSEQWV